MDSVAQDGQRASQGMIEPSSVDEKRCLLGLGLQVHGTANTINDLSTTKQEVPTKIGL